jgi:hypothetical protein
MVVVPVEVVVRHTAAITVVCFSDKFVIMRLFLCPLVHVVSAVELNVLMGIWTLVAIGAELGHQSIRGLGKKAPTPLVSSH